VASSRARQSRAFLERIDAVNPKLNAVVQIRADVALFEARTADRVPRSGVALFTVSR
jgi:Asp-tRNA(Asn)/Glu-tRNA(Gln) amidotransferase A subunit family amidase